MQSNPIYSSNVADQQHQQSSSLRAQMPGHAAESSSGGQLKTSSQGMEPLNEVMPLERTANRVDLSLHIPPRTMSSSSNKSNGKYPVQDSSSRCGSLARSFFQGQSFKNKVPVLDERTPLLSSDHDTRSDPIVPESASLASYIAALTWKRSVSLPVGQQPSHKPTGSANVQRSLSVPVRNVVILRSASFATQKDFGRTTNGDGQIHPDDLEDGDEEISEDEAICRICFEELCGQSSLKLECSCKGALSLMHEKCAMKWFGSKGNKKCDVCAQDILNLPVKLFRLQNNAQRGGRQQDMRHNSYSQLTRAWQDVVMLILISTMCYFFFLEQLLVDDMTSQAINIAAPISFILGLLSSISAIFLAGKDHVWSYSAFQFILTALMIHLFYSVLQVNAIYAVLFALVVSLGIAVSINLLVLLILARRREAIQTQMNANQV